MPFRMYVGMDDIPQYPETVCATSVADDPDSSRHYYTRLLNDVVECHRYDGGWRYTVHIPTAKEDTPVRLTTRSGFVRVRRDVMRSALPQRQRMRRRLYQLGWM